VGSLAQPPRPPELVDPQKDFSGFRFVYPVLEFFFFPRVADVLPDLLASLGLPVGPFPPFYGLPKIFP